MKIATFNVNGVNGRLPVLMRWLAEAEPDVACLQELKASDEKFPEPAIGEAGYRAVWHGQKSWNGVAILARNRAPMLTPRPTGRSGGCAQPLHRGRGRWDPDRLSVFAQRKSRPRPEVRLGLSCLTNRGSGATIEPRTLISRCDGESAKCSDSSRLAP